MTVELLVHVVETLSVPNEIVSGQRCLVDLHGVFVALSRIAHVEEAFEAYLLVREALPTSCARAAVAISANSAFAIWGSRSCSDEVWSDQVVADIGHQKSSAR
jgi:hypothetical protein